MLQFLFFCFFSPRRRVFFLKETYVGACKCFFSVGRLYPTCQKNLEQKTTPKKMKKSQKNGKKKRPRMVSSRPNSLLFRLHNVLWKPIGNVCYESVKSSINIVIPNVNCSSCHCCSQEQFVMIRIEACNGFSV
mgnify:CR=1 FL=1